jgi:hypothetical protein
VRWSWKQQNALTSPSVHAAVIPQGWPFTVTPEHRGLQFFTRIAEPQPSNSKSSSAISDGQRSVPNRNRAEVFLAKALRKRVAAE